MTTEHLSCAPGSGINEDLIRVMEGDALADIVVLDGATSVADANYIRIRHMDDHLALSLWCLGDSKAFVVHPDGAVVDLEVAPYGLTTLDDLGRRCREDGLEALMRELRQFALARAAGGTMAENTPVKSADDASAVIWTALAPDSTLKDRT
jgi:hypothetical protein